jgi:hypothetical protein
MHMTRTRPFETWHLILLAGLAAGFAEVFWVLLQSGSSTVVGASITTTFTGDATVTATSGWIGLGIHMGLSLVVAAAFIQFVWRPLRDWLSPVQTVALSMACLGGVWVFNFMILLPIINPAFVGLMPLGVTLISKLLFGAAMGGVLVYQTRR